MEGALKMDEITLDQLKRGEQCVIERYSGAGDLQGRLKELGLIKGTKVVVERFAPLGDPLEISVRGYHLAIRKVDAAQIIVSKLPL
jgi:Fe2+ transport system protein FeoA